MIFKHYLIRICKEPIGLVCLILLPVAIASLFSFINNTAIEGYRHIVNGFNMSATFQTMSMMVMFQFFCAGIVVDFMYTDLRSDMRWRLLASPQPLRKFIFANIYASIIFSIFSGLIIIVVGMLAFNVYLSTIWVTLTTLVVLAVSLTLLGTLLFLLIPNKRTAEAITFVLAFGQTLPLNFLPLENNAIRFIFERCTPFAFAFNAILYSGDTRTWLINPIYMDMGRSMMNLGFLVAFGVIIGIAVLIVSRKRSF